MGAFKTAVRFFRSVPSLPTDETMRSVEKAVREMTRVIAASEENEKENSRLLRQLVAANKDFINVIENFFAVRKKLDIEEARRREKRELDIAGTSADERY